MMDSLHIARSGLRTSRYAIDSTSNNIANEHTPGYKKRLIQTSEKDSILHNIGGGVSFDGVRRTTNQYLFSQIINQNSYSSYYSQQDATLSSAEKIFKETDSSGFSFALADFFTAVESLRADPSSSTEQKRVDSQANLLLNSMKGIYADLNEVQDDNLSLLKDQVDEVNSIIKEITHINEKIINTGETNDLLDKRDLLEKELSNYGDIDVNYDYGDYTLSFGGKEVIFNSTGLPGFSVGEEYIQQRDIYTTTDLDDASVSNGDIITLTLNNDVSINIIASVTGGTPYDLKQQIVDQINNNPEFAELEAHLDTSNNLVINSIEGGEANSFDLKIDVAGTIMTKDSLSVEAADHVTVDHYGDSLSFTGGSLKSLSEELTSETSNFLAYKKSLDDFVKAFVEAYSENSSTPMFKGASVETFEYVKNSAFNLSAADLEGIYEIQWAEDINIDSGSSQVTSFTTFYQNLLERVSTDVGDNKSLMESQDAVLHSMTSTYENLTKVDGDEEMINLMQYQAAYEANAKIITAVDEMLQTIINM